MSSSCPAGTETPAVTQDGLQDLDFPNKVCNNGVGISAAFFFILLKAPLLQMLSLNLEQEELRPVQHHDAPKIQAPSLQQVDPETLR